MNFYYGLIALRNNINLSADSFLHNKGFIGFLIGILVTALTTSFILTEDPRHIPLILRYSSLESFSRIAERHENGTYNLAFKSFLKMYLCVRVLFLIALIVFFGMIVAVAVLAK